MWPGRKVALQRVAVGGVAGRSSGESEHFNEKDGFVSDRSDSLSIISHTRSGLGSNYCDGVRVEPRSRQAG